MLGLAVFICLRPIRTEAGSGTAAVLPAGTAVPLRVRYIMAAATSSPDREDRCGPGRAEISRGVIGVSGNRVVFLMTLLTLRDTRSG